MKNINYKSSFIKEDTLSNLSSFDLRTRLFYSAGLYCSSLLVSLPLSLSGYRPFFDLVTRIMFIISMIFVPYLVVTICLNIYFEKKLSLYKSKFNFWIMLMFPILIILCSILITLFTIKYEVSSDGTKTANINMFLSLFIMFILNVSYGIFLDFKVMKPIRKVWKLKKKQEKETI